MTLQDLKDNRNEIIEKINVIMEYDQNAVKDVMDQMVKMLGYRGIRSTTALDYVEEVINILDLVSKHETLRGQGCFNRIQEINARQSANLMKHI